MYNIKVTGKAHSGLVLEVSFRKSEQKERTRVNFVEAELVGYYTIP